MGLVPPRGQGPRLPAVVRARIRPHLLINQRTSIVHERDDLLCLSSVTRIALPYLHALKRAYYITWMLCMQARSLKHLRTNVCAVVLNACCKHRTTTLVGSYMHALRALHTCNLPGVHAAASSELR